MKMISLQLAYNLEQREVQVINEINEVLSRIGMELEIVQHKQKNYLDINYDTDAYKKATSRNAGKKRKTISPTRVQDIKQMTKTQAAAELGVSRSTLYRRLKEAQESGINYII